MSNRRTLAALVVLAIAVGLLMAGCGSTSSSSGSSTSASTAPASTTGAATSTAASGAKPTSLTLGGVVDARVTGKMRLAYFASCTCNTYTVSMNNAARATAKQLGIDMTVFDPALRGPAQINQMQNALSQGYNAWAVESVSQGTCAMVRRALARGILVSIFNEQVCTSPYASGPDSYLKGTLNYVGGDETTEAFTNWVNRIQADNPGPQDVVLVVGTPGFHQTLVTQRAAAAAMKAHPEFKVTVLTVATYDLAGAQAAVQARLAADKNVTIIGGDYSDLTQGAVLAMNQAGRKNIRVYDMGGSRWAVGAVKSGQVALTSVFLPATESELSIRSLNTAWNGGGIGRRYVNILDTIGGNPFITSANVGSFTPQY